MKVKKKYISNGKSSDNELQKIMVAQPALP